MFVPASRLYEAFVWYFWLWNAVSANRVKLRRSTINLKIVEFEIDFIEFRFIVVIFSEKDEKYSKLLRFEVPKKNFRFGVSGTKKVARHCCINWWFLIVTTRFLYGTWTWFMQGIPIGKNRIYEIQEEVKFSCKYPITYKKLPWAS